jgi:two-component system sensor histidine kinase YesM
MMSLRTKLFAAFFALIVTPLFLIGGAAYFFVSNTIEDKYSQQAELTLRALSQSIEFLFMEMNKVTDSTIASTALQDVLKTGGNQVPQQDFLALNEIQRNFLELLVNHPSVSYAFMYTFEDPRIVPIYSKDYFTAMPFERFKELPVYRTVIERGGLPKWVGPYEYPELTGADPVFTQIRAVKDIYTLRDRGILLVQLKNSGLEKLFQYYRFNQEIYATRFFIVGDQGNILFDSSDELHGGNLQQFMKTPMSPVASYSSERQTFEGVDSVISSIGIGQENWKLVSVASWSSLSKEVRLYSKWVSIIILLSLLSSFVFLLLFANRIAKTIISVVRFMRRVEEGDLYAGIQEKGNDELGLLTKGLNRMIARIQMLLESVKQEQEQKTKAELRVLQAQIKPHFLFNTLESINVLAVQNEGRKVSQMVLRLANILRISFQDKEKITLGQEVEHLKSYLEIQRFRFADVFEYQLDIPEELLNCTLQKLTLQPLVENCIQHGFEGMERQGLIQIRAEAASGRLLLTVEDNGRGIPTAELAKFQYMAASEDPTIVGEDKVQPEHRGLGVRSVADRIRIQYGREYGLFICSHEGSGTIIQCVIPMDGWGDSGEA